MHYLHGYYRAAKFDTYVFIITNERINSAQRCRCSSPAGFFPHRYVFTPAAAAAAALFLTVKQLAYTCTQTSALPSHLCVSSQSPQSDVSLLDATASQCSILRIYIAVCGLMRKLKKNFCVVAFFPPTSVIFSGFL